MRITPNEDDINEIKELWQWVGERMRELGFTPETLAPLVGFSQDRIERGISGEPIWIRHVLPKFVKAFGLDDDREAKPYEGIPSYDECKKLLKPPTALTPGERLPHLYKF